MEKKIHYLLVYKNGYPLSLEDKESLKYHLVLSLDFLVKEESMWRLKRREIWIYEGDKNMIFFTNFPVIEKI